MILYIWNQYNQRPLILSPTPLILLFFTLKYHIFLIITSISLPYISRKTNVTVLGYRVYIMYGTDGIYGGFHGCFQLPPTTRSFRFDRSNGFQDGCMFQYSVTPQPVTRFDLITMTTMTRVQGCPLSPVSYLIGKIIVNWKFSHSPIISIENKGCIFSRPKF